MDFSLNWFKSKKKEENVQKIYVPQSTTSYGVDPLDHNVEFMHVPYKSIKMVNDVITVVLLDGTIIIKPSAVELDFIKISKATTIAEILNLVTLPEILEEKLKVKAEEERNIVLHKGIELLKEVSDFRVEDNTVYMVGTNRSVPELLVNEFIEIVGSYDFSSISMSINEYVAKNEKYQSLKNFFLWACLNPRAEVANDLYDFLKRNSFKITKQGFFAALRNVVTLNDNSEEFDNNRALVDFVSNSYNKIKAVWKQKPSKFDVYRNTDHFGENSFYLWKIEETPNIKNNGNECMGNLETLYKQDMPEMKGNRFTDDHTKTFDIRVGKVVSMPMKKCSWSTADCDKAGLHFTSDQIHYVGCGDTSMLVLINPMKVVGIGTSKGRCYEYLPIMTVPREEATQLLHDLDFDTLELDEDYVIHELESLSEKVKSGFIAETTKYSFNLPATSTEEIETIIKSLSLMKELISKRVSVIK